jgi:hypothetical protein
MTVDLCFCNLRMDWQDVSDSALPNSIDSAAVTVQGARKFEQLGPDAASKVIMALLDKAELGERSAVVGAQVFSGDLKGGPAGSTAHDLSSWRNSCLCSTYCMASQQATTFELRSWLHRGSFRT